MSSSGTHVRTQQVVGQLNVGTGLVILASLVGFIISFFHWYGVSTASSATTYLNGWHGWGIPAAILFLVAALIGLGDLVGQSIGNAFNEGVLTAVIGIAAAVSIVIFMVTEGSGYGSGYDKGPLYGAWIGLISAIVLAIGGILRTRESSV